MKDYKEPGDLLGEKGVFRELRKRLLERAMSAEMDGHPGYGKGESGSKPTSNRRNGSSRKTVLTGEESVEIEVPRDRAGTFEPKIVRKHQRRFDGFDDKIVSMYSLGMTTRDIQAHLKEIYGVDVSPELVSDVTDKVMEDVAAWQLRPLERVYPILYLDCVVVKCREDRVVRNKSVFLALAVNMEGQKELLGMWIAQNEGAKFWLSVVADLKNRGVEDILIACADGLRGFPEAINSVFPETRVQRCVVHQVRDSLKYVSHKDRKAVAADLKNIYGADTVEIAELGLKTFAEKWDSKYPTISRQWARHWDETTPFFEWPKDIRRAIYTTNAIESLNHSLR